VRLPRTLIIFVLALGLLSVSVPGTLAQGEAAGSGEPVVFGWSVSPGDTEGVAMVDATDPRMVGTLTIGMGEGAVVIGDVPILAPFSLRVANDDGAWAGTGRAYRGSDGQAVSIWELIGEGGYEGLRVFMFGDGEIEEPWGLIVSEDAIPPYPPVPAG